MVKEMDFPGNSYCGKQQYIGLKLALHILVVTKMSPPTLGELQLTEVRHWITLSCPVTALLCQAQAHSSEWHQPQNRNLGSKSWTCDTSLYGPDFREPQRRETHQHTPGLHLFTTHLGHCNILSLEWPFRRGELKAMATKMRMAEE